MILKIFFLEINFIIIYLTLDHIASV